MHAETSLHMSQMAHQAGAYLWILCIIIFLYEATSSVSSPPPPPGYNTCPSQGYQPVLNLPKPIYTPG